MILTIDVMDETNRVTEEQIQLVQDLLQYTAKQEQVKEGSELSITFVDNSRIQEINKEYRQKDAATDVISFAMEEMGEGEIEIIGSDEPALLGDIIISIDRMEEQAAEYGHSNARELGFLAVHGFLHLLGYDHIEEDDRVEMEAAAETYLSAMGVVR